jgi:predicted DNA-binding protein
MCMIRTQILLPLELRRRIKLRAEKDQKPQGQIIRELIQKGLETEEQASTGDALLKLADLGKRLGVRGPKDLAANHDDYFAKEV